ncbi:MAG TPA: hypothetical protein VLA37_12195 [Sphingomonadaceae bacterium]|nr:hypothetical protein [Sphingomonadaceae bacterium]
MKPGLSLSWIAALLALAVPARAEPDWSGTWYRESGTFYYTAPDAPIEEGSPPLDDPRWHPPYTPEFEAIYQANLKRIAEGLYPDPVTVCGTPAGWPRMLVTPDGYEFVVRPEQTWILSENGPNIVRIYTDGRDHPPADEMWNTYTGHSVGYWEGDKLHFDTIGLNGVGQVILGRQGVVMSDQLRVTTTIEQIEDGRLMVSLVLEDPVALTRPFPVRILFSRSPDGTNMWDYACAENNRNPVDESGWTLTLDTDGNVIDLDVPDGGE